LGVEVRIMSSYSHVTPEMAILFACGQSVRNEAFEDRFTRHATGMTYSRGRACLYPATSHLTGLLSRPIDWNLLLRLAHQHHMIPLLSLHLQKAAATDAIPTTFRKALHEANVRNSSRNLLIVRQLLLILTALKRAGVHAIPIKGPVLAQQAFGSIALRSFSDIDLLIAGDDLGSARHVLTQLGYQDRETRSRQGNDVHRNVYYEHGMINADLPLEVELHYQLDWPCCESKGEIAAIINRAQTMSLCGTTVPTLSPEDQFLYLAFHGAKHLWTRLEWLCCLAELVRHSSTGSTTSIDWDIVESRTRTRGYRHIVTVALLLTQQVCGTSIPDALGSLVANDRLGQNMAKVIFNRSFAAQAAMSPFDQFKYNLKFRGSALDRAKYFWMRVMTPTELDLNAIPNHLHPLLPAIRPFRITSDFAHRTARSLMKRLRA